MTGLGRDTSRSPDRTGVCRTGVGTLSAHEMTTGRVFHQQISQIMGQIVIYRPSIEADSLRGALRATIFGNLRESSGEFRLQGFLHEVAVGVIFRVVPVQSTWRWESGAISTNLDGIWGMSVHTFGSRNQLTEICVLHRCRLTKRSNV